MSDTTALAGMPAHVTHLLDAMFAAIKHMSAEVGTVISDGATLANFPEGKTVLALVWGVLIGRGADPALLDQGGAVAEAAFGLN